MKDAGLVSCPWDCCSVWAAAS